MGILNLTPDSFFENSRHFSAESAVLAAKQMIDDGADWIDLGGQSTRPGAETLSAEEEAERVLPAVEAIHKAFPNLWLSIDTYYASVAKEALSLGASIVNDISAGENDAAMLTTVAQHHAVYIAMHKKGNPKDMQISPNYLDVTQEIWHYFKLKSEELQRLGIYDWIVDPGFGFGKTAAHNFQLLNDLHQFTLFNKPVLVGISRKGMIWKTLQTSPDMALNGTTALHMAALLNGATVLRVHDVKAVAEVRTLFLHLKNKQASL